MTAYLLAALDMAGTTVDEGGLVYSALEAAVADGVPVGVGAGVGGDPVADLPVARSELAGQRPATGAS